MTRGSIALWLVPREGEHRNPQAEAAELSAAARERMDAMRKPEARDAQQLSRAWLSRALRAHFGPVSASWGVGVDCNGCAFLHDAPPEIAIAFAHARDTIAIAIGYDCGGGLGIDLEDRLDRDDPLLAPIILSPVELERYHCLATGKRRRRYILSRWVAKEAYAKARRAGLALAFDAIEMTEFAADRFYIHDPHSFDGMRWEAQLFEPHEGLAVAVAWAPMAGKHVVLDVYGVSDLGH